MIVKAFFDDDDIDFLDISLSDFEEIEKYQDEFFSYMFDKNNEHNYWVMANGKKIGCDYGIEAFTDWLKNAHNIRAYRVKPDISVNDYPILYF